MPYINVGKENSSTINLYYEDHGAGKPVVLIHGWPLSGASWEKQIRVLLDRGYRVITYDRRGFGESSQPTFGYEYDILAKDLDKVMTKLDLYHVTLIGFSMGTGEVVRYLNNYGSDRVERAILLSSVPPFLLKTDDNPQGVDQSIFEGIKSDILVDRLRYLSKFIADFYNSDLLEDKLVSQEVIRYHWNIATKASPKGTLDCVSAWLTDFRKDLRELTIPTLIIHGDADRILPISATGARLHEAIKGSRFISIEGGPHGLIWTHAEIVNREILAFLEQAPLLEEPLIRKAG